MPQEPSFMNWSKDGPPIPSAVRPGLVTAGAAVLLLGVACLVLGAFAGFGPASEGASAAPQKVVRASDPLVKGPLTSGEPSSTAAPVEPVVRRVPRKAVPTAPATDPTTGPSPTASRAPHPAAPSDPTASAGVTDPECRDRRGSGGWGSHRNGRGSDGTRTDRCRRSTDARDQSTGRHENRRSDRGDRENSDRDNRYEVRSVVWGGFWGQASSYGW
jgi:hypothetical protein